MIQETSHHSGSKGTMPRSEDFTLQLIMVVLVFVPLGFVGRVLEYYSVGGGWFASSVYAMVGTVLSTIIFLPLGYHFKLSKTLAVGFLINTASLLFLHLVLWVPKSLTIKSPPDIFLFLDGYVTAQGVAYFLPLALGESVISCLGFIIYWRLSKRLLGGHR
jgi:hypothetical protein